MLVLIPQPRTATTANLETMPDKALTSFKRG